VTRRRERGIAFVSVLATLAIGAVLVAKLQGLSERQTGFAVSSADLTRARAIAEGAVLELRGAWAEDGKTSPDQDHWGEAWSQLRQSQTAIQGGSIAVEITDLAGRINLNALAEPGLQAVPLLSRALREVGLEGALASRIAGFIQNSGPIADLAGLEPLGLSRADLRSLGKIAAALPGEAVLNLNTAPPELLKALFPAAGLAKRLIAERDKAGFLTQETLRRFGTLPPPGTGWSTRYIRLLVEVRQRDVLTRREIFLTRDPQEPSRVSLYRQTSTGAAP
jgi:type II secretory pathway component PulK